MNGEKKKTGITFNKKNKQVKVKQIHLSLWFIIITTGVVLSYAWWNIMTAIGGQGAPVVGTRYEGDLDPKLTQAELDPVIEKIKGVSEVEDASGNLLSATVRFHVDVKDGMNTKQVEAKLKEVWKVITEELPVETYFTNAENKKMYDIEVDCYTYKPNKDKKAGDDWVYLKALKNGASKKYRIDYLTTPKDKELVKQIVRNTE